MEACILYDDDSSDIVKANFDSVIKAMVCKSIASFISTEYGFVNDYRKLQ